MKVTPNRYPKRIRLKDFPYKGCYRYFITLRCDAQVSHFVNGDLVTRVLETLAKTAEREDFCVWAYCFMPDHLHLLAEGKTGDADMRRFVSTFKQKTALRFNTPDGPRLWQPNYYERVLRRDEATSAVARYIFDNPVRKGLASDYAQYPYSGSLELSNLNQVLA